jgi:hypothetical protein
VLSWWGCHVFATHFWSFSLYFIPNIPQNF